MTPEQRIRWVYDAKNSEELNQRYDEWAEEYDEHIEKELDYMAPALTVEVLSRHVAPDAKILDAGAGTGLIGQNLYKAGYQNLTALDSSLGMLEQAKQKGVYAEFSQQDLNGPLDFVSSTFDAVVSIGVFTYGHVKAAAFAELIRVTRSGGIIIFSVVKKFYEEGDFCKNLRQLETEGKWMLLEDGITFRFSAQKTTDVDSSGLLFVYTVH